MSEHKERMTPTERNAFTRLFKTMPASELVAMRRAFENAQRPDGQIDRDAAFRMFFEYLGHPPEKAAEMAAAAIADPAPWRSSMLDS